VPPYLQSAVLYILMMHPLYTHDTSSLYSYHIFDIVLDIHVLTNLCTHNTSLIKYCTHDTSSLYSYHIFDMMLDVDVLTNLCTRSHIIDQVVYSWRIFSLFISHLRYSVRYTCSHEPALYSWHIMDVVVVDSNIDIVLDIHVLTNQLYTHDTSSIK